MSNIKYIDEDLFNAKGFLGHACNCQGVWGSGIAKQFAQKFIAEKIVYEDYCHNFEALGDCLIINRIVCLFTSENYGNFVSSKEDILQATKSSLKVLNNYGIVKELNIPKINSGLFKLPWEETEKILLQFPEIQFNVYTGKKLEVVE